MAQTIKRLCQCETCAPQNPAPTYTQDWRLTCEARWLMRLPRQMRQEYLDKPAVQARRSALVAILIKLRHESPAPPADGVDAQNERARQRVLPGSLPRG